MRRSYRARGHFQDLFILVGRAASRCERRGSSQRPSYWLAIAWPIVVCVSIHAQAAALVWNGPASECSARPRDTPTKKHGTSSCAPARCSYTTNMMNISFLIAPSPSARAPVARCRPLYDGSFYIYLYDDHGEPPASRPGAPGEKGVAAGRPRRVERHRRARRRRDRGRPCTATIMKVAPAALEDNWGQPEGRFPFVFPNRPRFLQEPLIHRWRASRSGKGHVGVVFEPIFALARQKCWEPSAAISSRRSRMAVKGACHAQPDRQQTRPDSRSIGLTVLSVCFDAIPP